LPKPASASTFKGNETPEDGSPTVDEARKSLSSSLPVGAARIPQQTYASF